jgi:catechol 2,3-dioxygenase-like lactoylglutathione lyase family enzyme
VPVDHVNLPVADLGRSRAFYVAALAPLGYRCVYESDVSLGFGDDTREPIALRLGPAPSAGSHVAFTATNNEQVDAFHAAALTAGGSDNGAPGERPYGGYYYAAFVLDPDGHNIEVVNHGDRA